MSSILDSIRAAAGSAFATIFDAATLYRVTTRVADGRGGWVQVWSTYTARALVDDYSTFLRGTLGIPVSERKIIVLGASCTIEPTVGDLITAQGATWEITEVKRDPAAATYECRSKPAPTPAASAFYLQFTDDDGVTQFTDDDAATLLTDDL
jgi:hypothetical protein